MLKTIKTTKQMRLDELVKYIFENDVRDKFFVSSYSNQLEVDNNGDVRTGGLLTIDDTFTVEIEELITKDTVFDELMCVYKRETLIKVNQSSINGIFKSNLEDEVNEIHALINGRLELVWERDGE